MRPILACALVWLALLGGCSQTDIGIVELYWQFDDAELRRLYPLGELSDTCELESASGTIRYDLAVRLTIVENTDTCAADPGLAECEVTQVMFDCSRSRGTALEVPVSAAADGSDPGYLMFVEAVVDPTDTPAFVPDPSCVVGPGPRVRQVRKGRITDLEVFQFIVGAIDIEGQLLDIDACRPPEQDAGTETGG